MELSRSAGTHTHTHTHSLPHRYPETHEHTHTHKCIHTHTHTRSTRMINLSINAPISCGEPSSFPCKVPVKLELAKSVCLCVCVSLFHHVYVCVSDLCNHSLFTTFYTPYHCSLAEMQNIVSRYSISLFYISATLYNEFSWHVHFTACWSDDGSWEREAAIRKGPD